MSEISKAIHSMTFGDKNTWDDWHLVPTSRPTFSFPSIKTQSVDIPGANGKIDLTEALTGYPAYNNRTGSFEFMVVNTDQSLSVDSSKGYSAASTTQWQQVYSKIANYLHGQNMQLTYEDDPGWYYKGRFDINQWSSDQEYSKITIDYDVEPFKYSLIDTGDQWLWDPFNFETGVIRTYNTDELQFDTAGKQFKIYGTNYPCVPTVFVSVPSTVTTSKGTFQLKAGSNKNPLIMLYPGKQYWTFKANSGSGNAAIYFRERSL